MDDLIPEELAQQEAFVNRPEPEYCPHHQHYKWCDHNGGALRSTGYGPPAPQG